MSHGDVTDWFSNGGAFFIVWIARSGDDCLILQACSLIVLMIESLNINLSMSFGLGDKRWHPTIDTSSNILYIYIYVNMVLILVFFMVTFYFNSSFVFFLYPMLPRPAPDSCGLGLLDSSSLFPHSVSDWNYNYQSVYEPWCQGFRSTHNQT